MRSHCFDIEAVIPSILVLQLFVAVSSCFAARIPFDDKTKNGIKWASGVN